MKAMLEVDRTRERLERVGLGHAARELSTLLSETVKEEYDAHRFLDRMLQVEWNFREEQRVKTSLKLSGLPLGQTLANFDFAFQPSVERSRIETLATCNWIREHETLLLQGPPGVGKTHLAVGLGVKAIEHGFSVEFYRVEDMLHAMRKNADCPLGRLKGKKYLKVALLIVDEVGFQPMDRKDANLFFRLVSYRYGKGSILITTNKSVKDWPEILAGDEVMTTALLDRLLHRSYVLNVRGRSYRLKELEGLLK